VADALTRTIAAEYEDGMSAPLIRILGIDPGLRRTGWGVVDVLGNRLMFVACGSIDTRDQEDVADRLVAIHRGLAQVLADHRPQEAAVEATFVNKNPSLLVPAQGGLRVSEYAPNLIKKTIVGAGHGEKAQIRMMIGVLLPKATPQTEDAADALAIAVTHAHHRQSLVLRAAVS